LPVSLIATLFLQQPRNKNKCEQKEKG
jgi:hypothetical protein